MQLKYIVRERPYQLDVDIRRLKRGSRILLRLWLAFLERALIVLFDSIRDSPKCRETVLERFGGDLSS
jgi:hypothetical protein